MPLNFSSLAIGDPEQQAILSEVLNDGIAKAAPLPTTKPIASIKSVSTDIFNPSVVLAEDVNKFFNSLMVDLGNVYCGANYSDLLVSTLETKGTDILNVFSQTLDILEDQISAISDLQQVFSAGYTQYIRANLITDVQIETDLDIISGYPALFDAQAQAVTLDYVTSDDVLHTPDGQLVVTPNIDYQIGFTLDYFQSIRTPYAAVDQSDTSFWSQIVVSDAPIEIQWPSDQSIYYPAASNGVMPFVYSGAVSEYSITFQSPQTFNYLTVSPYCEHPINLAAIFVIKRTASTNSGETFIANVDTQNSLYYITEYNSNRVEGYLYLDQTVYLDLPTQQDVEKIVLVFHQPHYSKEIFSLSTKTVQYNALWQYMLGNSINPSTGVDLSYSFNKHDDILTNAMKALYRDSQNDLQDYVKYIYSYGAYEIGLFNRNYVTSGVLVSEELSTSANLIQGAVQADFSLPMENTFIVASSAWVGPTALIPNSYTVPAATLDFDLTYGNNLVWYPVAPLGVDTIYENIILGDADSNLTQFTLRMQARPGTPVYITSYDGIGDAYLVGAVYAPALVGANPTTIVLPFAELAAPGFYVIQYTPMDTSFEVNFIDVSGPRPPSFQTTVEITAQPGDVFLADETHGIELPFEPFIDSSRIDHKFEPNGNTEYEYVPITVTITGLDLEFRNPHTERLVKYHTVKQNHKHADNLFASFVVHDEKLTTKDINTSAATEFFSEHNNLNVVGKHYPQLYQTGDNAVLFPISPQDSTGNTVWIVDASTGKFTFTSGNSAAVGSLRAKYWYFDDAKYRKPMIINKTKYDKLGGNNILPQDALTPFHIDNYPIIEYIQIENMLYFNMDIPATAVVHVTYNRLYDSMRMRATFTRVDPTNQSATPKLSAFTLTSKDSNSTSDDPRTNIFVTWPDIQYYYLGPVTQVNPVQNLVNLPHIPHSKHNHINNSSSILPVLPLGISPPQYVEFHWYEVVNCGSNPEYIRAKYNNVNGTVVYVDLTHGQYVVPDGGRGNDTYYYIMAADGSNNFILDPGQGCYIGIGNIYTATGANVISPATICSYFTDVYLDNINWAFGAKAPDPELSAIKFVIS